MLLTKMADSVEADDLPIGLPGYAGYVDGHWPSFPAIVKRFYPNAHCVSLTVTGKRAAFIDCEQGNHSPAFCVKWLLQQLTLSSVGDNTATRLWRHGIYFPMSYHADIVREIARQMPNTDRERYRLWGACWTGGLPAVLPAGLDALQYIGDEGRGYDVSAVAHDFYDDFVYPGMPTAYRDDVADALGDAGALTPRRLGNAPEGEASAS